MDKESPSAGVFGAGRFGVALACHLAKNGVPTRLWGRDTNRLQAWERQGGPLDLFPGIRFPSSLSLVHDPKSVFEADMLVLAVPTQALRACLTDLFQAKRPNANSGPVFVLLSKGLEDQSAKLPHEILLAALGVSRFAVLSGPTFAEELIQGLPMAMVPASQDLTVAESIQKVLSSGRLRVYTSEDVLGVELGGALKNIYAIAAGISDGLRLGHSARASLVSRAMAEMMRTARALGAQSATLAGLSGLGDLLLSTTSPKSRNHRFGVLIANGLSPSQFFAQPHFLAEGAFSVKAFLRRIDGLHVEAPIVTEVYRVLFEGTNPKDALERLLERSLKPEMERF